MKNSMKCILGLIALLGLAACGGNDPAEQGTDSTPAAAANPPPAVAVVEPCDRDCLLGFVDRYIEALVAHDPSRAPFATNAQFTENAQVLTLGDALWGTASAPPDKYKLVVADPETSTAAFFLIMKEAGDPIWLSGRLSVANQQITELETVIIRSGGGFSNFEVEAVDPLWDEIVPPEERNTREELFAAADGYMESLEKNLVDHVAFDESCDRLENGVKTANNPALEGIGAMSCRENINSGMWVYIKEISPRRFLVADIERGISMGVFMFHHDGASEYAMVNGEKVMYEGATRRPFTTVIPEMFKVKNGKIYRIMATMTSIPYKSKSGWE